MSIEHSDNYESDFSYSTKSVKDNSLLKEKLFKLMKDKGIVEKLKIQVRQNLISEISSKDSFDASRDNCVNAKNFDIFQQTASSVVALFLQQSNYPYTLSVFIPEIGINRDKLYVIDEIFRILQIDVESEFYRNMQLLLKKGERSFLWCLLKILSEQHSIKRKDTDIQMDKAKDVIPLSERMQKLDEEFADRQKQGILKTQQLYEDRMISYQRELERRLRQEMENEIERFKQHEIAMLKLKEEEKFCQLLKEKSKMLDEEYQNRLAALKERENNYQTNMHQLKESQEREIYLQRQQMLRDINGIQERELLNKKEKERQEKEHDLMKEQHKMKVDKVEEMISKLKEKEMSLDLRVQEEVNSIRLTEERRLVQKWKEVELLDAKVKEDQKNLISEKEITEKLKNELFRKSQLFKEMEIIGYPALQHKNESLEAQVEELKKEIEQQISVNQQDKHKIDCLLKQKLAPSFEQAVLTNELERARETFRREKAIIEEQKEMLEKRLIDEVRQNKMLSEQHSELQDVVESLSRRLSDVKENMYQDRHGWQTTRSVAITNREISPHSLKQNCLDYDFKQTDDLDSFNNETKHKLMCLDEETDQITKAYLEFKHRLTNNFPETDKVKVDPIPDMISQSFNIGLKKGRLIDTSNLENFEFTSPLYPNYPGSVIPGPSKFDQSGNSKDDFASFVAPTGFPTIHKDTTFQYNKGPVKHSTTNSHSKQNQPFNQSSEEFRNAQEISLDKPLIDENRDESASNKSVRSIPSIDTDQSEDVIKLDDKWTKPDEIKLRKDDENVPEVKESEKGHIATANNDDDIDPVVRHYMNLLQQKKEQELNKPKSLQPAEQPNVNNFKENVLSDDEKTKSQYSADEMSEKKQEVRSESDSFW